MADLDAANKRVILVEGREFDLCNRPRTLGEVDGGHWARVTRAHQGIIEHAFDDDPPNGLGGDGGDGGDDDVNDNTGVNVIAVLEQDTRGDGDVKWSPTQWNQFDAAFADDAWELIRLSYRPHDFESGQVFSALGEDQGCPGQCACRVPDPASQMCFAKNPGCKLQGSDAYMMHRRAYDRLHEQLRWGKIVDVDAFMAVEGQWLTRPALAYQSSYSVAVDDVSAEELKKVNDAYLEKCAFSGEW